MRSAWSRSLPSWVILLLVLASGAIGLLACRDPVAGWQGGGIVTTSSEADRPKVNTSDLLQTYPGIVRPAALAAPDARLGDAEEVIGVVANGRARAYPVRSLSRPDHHVVNDTIGAVPVSITYCNIERCARAFTGENNTGPLKLGVGGQHHARGLLLLANGSRFYQSTQEPYAAGDLATIFPYKSFPATVTSWKAWREQHPDTELSRPDPDSTVRPAPAGVGKPSINVSN